MQWEAERPLGCLATHLRRSIYYSLMYRMAGQVSQVLPVDTSPPGFTPAPICSILGLRRDSN